MKQFYILVFFIVIFSLSMTLCIGQNINDIDGNLYKTISIGNQVWMAENLKVSHFRNGDEISNVTDRYLWTKTSGPAACRAIVAAE